MPFRFRDPTTGGASERFLVAAVAAVLVAMVIAALVVVGWPRLALPASWPSVETCINDGNCPPGFVVNLMAGLVFLAWLGGLAYVVTHFKAWRIDVSWPARRHHRRRRRRQAVEHAPDEEAWFQDSAPLFDQPFTDEAGFGPGPGGHSPAAAAPATIAPEIDPSGGLSDLPVGLADLPPGLAEAPPGLADLPPGFADLPPDFAEAPPGFAETPPGLAETPPDFAETPPGLAETPPGFADPAAGPAEPAVDSMESLGGFAEPGLSVPVGDDPYLGPGDTAPAPLAHGAAAAPADTEDAQDPDDTDYLGDADAEGEEEDLEEDLSAPPMIVPVRAYYYSRRGDTLRSVAAQFLNNPNRWKEVRSLNAASPGVAGLDPDKQVPRGTALALPGDPMPWGKPDPVYLWTVAEKFLFAAWGRDPTPEEVAPFWRGLTRGSQLEARVGPTVLDAYSSAALGAGLAADDLPQPAAGPDPAPPVPTAAPPPATPTAATPAAPAPHPEAPTAPPAAPPPPETMAPTAPPAAPAPPETMAPTAPPAAPAPPETMAPTAPPAAPPPTAATPAAPAPLPEAPTQPPTAPAPTAPPAAPPPPETMAPTAPPASPADAPPAPPPPETMAPTQPPAAPTAPPAAAESRTPSEPPPPTQPSAAPGPPLTSPAPAAPESRGFERFVPPSQPPAQPGAPQPPHAPAQPEVPRPPAQPIPQPPSHPPAQPGVPQPPRAPRAQPSPPLPSQVHVQPGIGLPPLPPPADVQPGVPQPPHAPVQPDAPRPPTDVAPPYSGLVETSDPYQAADTLQMPNYLPSLTGAGAASRGPDVEALSAGGRTLAGSALGDAMMLLRLARHRRRLGAHDPLDPVLESARRNARIDSLRFIEAAMRHLRAVTTDRGLAKPRVLAARHGTYGFELLLGDPVAAVEGWTSTAGGYVLELPPATRAGDLAAVAEGPSLCPLLVPVGDTLEGPLLLNLDEIGCLVVSGPQSPVTSLLGAIVVALASSPLSENTGITTVGLDAGVDLPGFERVQSVSFDSAELERLIQDDSPGGDTVRNVLVVGPGNDLIVQRGGQVATMAGSRLTLVGAATSGSDRWLWRISVDDTATAVVQPINATMRAAQAIDPSLVPVGQFALRHDPSASER